MDIVGAVSGIRKAPDEPPEDMSVFPFAVAWPGETRHEYNVPGERKTLMNIVLELHVARKDLPRDYATLIPYADSIPNAIMDDQTLGGVVDTFWRIDVAELGILNWNTVQTIGYRFTLVDVKLRTAIT